MDIQQFTDLTADRIQDWIDEALTVENGCKRNPTQEDIDDFDGNISWVFTQKGERLYQSYLSKATRLIEKKYPGQIIPELITGVVYF